MALTISIEGKGVIANCDGVPNDTAGGLWTKDGGGTIAISNDVFLVGTSCVGGKYASKSGVQNYDLQAGNELNFTEGGNEYGQHLYMWVAMTALGTLDTLATYPLCIRLSSQTPANGNYIDYLIAGNDDKNGWSGGFKCFVVDPTKPPSRVSGTQASIIASVRALGIWIDCSTSARADSIFIDQISVGSGLRVTGTSTTPWQDVVDYCTDYANRGWGQMQEREGIFYNYGEVYWGNSAGTTTCSFAETDAPIIKFGKSEYYYTPGTAWLPSTAANLGGIIIEDAVNYATTFSDGSIVGSDKGRGGSTFIGDTETESAADLYGGSNASSVTTLYGTTFRDFYGGIVMGDDAQHVFYSGSVSGCGQFDPVGAPVLRNITFSDTNAASSALLWNTNIDIEDCQFINNDDGAGVEHPAQGSFNYTGLVFTDNTFDILYSAAASSGVLTINADTESSVTSSEITNPTGNSVSILSSRAITIHVEDVNGDPIEAAQVYVQKSAAGKSWNYTADLNNNVGGSSFVVNEVVDTDIPQSGWLNLWNKSENSKQGYRYASWTGKTFTMLPEITANCTGGGTSTSLEDDTTINFVTADLLEGDSVRNSTDDSWAVIDEINNSNSITTSVLVDGSDNTWTSGDTYVFHRLVKNYTDNDDLIDIPLMSMSTDSGGDAVGSYNWGAIGVELPILIRVRSNSPQKPKKYIPFDTTGSITADGYTLNVVLQEDVVA